MNFKLLHPKPPLLFPRTLTNRARTARIILHHYHHETATPHTVERWHINERGFNGIGYHFCIDMDGTCWYGRPADTQGAHTAGNNADSIGVAFQGRYDDHTTAMPALQFNAGVWLIRLLRCSYGNIPVFGHGEVSPSACPGRFFPLEEMKTLVYRGSSQGKPELRKFSVNGTEIEVPGIIHEGRIYPKLRPIIEAMGARVTHERETDTFVISSNG